MVDDRPVLPGEGDEVSDGEKVVKPEAELDDLRASMAEEEQARLREKKNSGLLKKVTGLLRRKTGTLEAAQAQPAEPEPSSPFTSPLDEESSVSAETPSVDVERLFSALQNEGEGAPLPGAFIPDEPHEGESPQPEAGGAFVWDGEEDEPALKWEPEELQPAFHSEAFDAGEDAWTGISDQPLEPGAVEVPAFDEDETAEPELDTGLVESALEPEAEIAAAEGLEVTEGELTEGDSVNGISVQPDDLRAELMPEAAPAVEAPKKTTRSLLKRFTGWLNPDSVKPEEPLPEVTDDELADRLLKVQSTEATVEIPGQRKFVYEEYEPTPAAETVEDRPGGDEEVDPFSRLPQAPDFESKVFSPDSLRGLTGESLLQDEWVDKHARFLSEEPVAEEFSDLIAAPVQEEIVKAPSRLSELSTATDEESPAIEEVRSQVLVDYEEPPADADFTQPESFAERTLAWGRKNLGWLIVLFLLLAAVAVLMQTRPWEKPPAPIPNTPVPSELPFPVGLEMTGGWFYDIQRSTIIENQWQPQGAEWLDNSQLRRVVALPWNKQSEAVIQTLERGDQINLIFSNNDLMPFLVRSVERLERGDVTLFTAKEPGLVIFLYGEESEQRWVVLALPKN